MNMKKKILTLLLDLLWKSETFKELVKTRTYSDFIYPHEKLESEYEKMISKLQSKISELNQLEQKETVNKPKRRYNRKSKTLKK